MEKKLLNLLEYFEQTFVFFLYILLWIFLYCLVMSSRGINSPYPLTGGLLSKCWPHNGESSSAPIPTNRSPLIPMTPIPTRLSAAGSVWASMAVWDSISNSETICKSCLNPISNGVLDPSPLRDTFLINVILPLAFSLVYGNISFRTIKYQESSSISRGVCGQMVILPNGPVILLNK